MLKWMLTSHLNVSRSFNAVNIISYVRPISLRQLELAGRKAGRELL